VLKLLPAGGHFGLAKGADDYEPELRESWWQG
jgi:hypothetical protein